MREATMHGAIGSISASPTAYPLREYGRAGTQNDRLREVVIVSTSPYPRNGYAVGDAEIGHNYIVVVVAVVAAAVVFAAVVVGGHCVGRRRYVLVRQSRVRLCWRML